MKTYRFILLVQQNYTFEILRPMQAEMKARGYQVLWLALGNDIKLSLFDNDEQHTRSIAQAIAFAPDAVFVTGNVVPDFIPGLKVQVFHGFEWKKKGHFRIRGSFDLYCTQGPLFTRKFQEFAEQHGYFDVLETGWPKMDNVFPLQSAAPVREQKQILYLPTFSPSLTSAPDLLPHIETLARTNKHHWIVKFHPKMASDLIAQYQQMAVKLDNVSVYAQADLMCLIRECDLVLSDTSSAIAESLLHRKPVVTYRNSKPDEFVIDFDQAAELSANIDMVFANADEQDKKFDLFAAEYHPTHDGKSSGRIIDGAIHCIENGLQAKGRKPANLIRNLKLRKQENYWPWTKSSK